MNRKAAASNISSNKRLSFCFCQNKLLLDHSAGDDNIVCLRSILEMAHSDLTSEETDQLVEKMFVTAELDKHGVLTLENFVKMLAGEQRMMWDVSLEWKGTGRLCSPTHIYTYAPTVSHIQSLSASPLVHHCRVLGWVGSWQKLAHVFV